jgi:hypothetical protein
LLLHFEQKLDLSKVACFFCWIKTTLGIAKLIPIAAV